MTWLDDYKATIVAEACSRVGLGSFVYVCEHCSNRSREVAEQRFDVHGTDSPEARFEMKTDSPLGVSLFALLACKFSWQARTIIRNQEK